MLINLVIPAPALVRPGTEHGVRLVDGATVSAPAEWLGEVEVVAEEIIGDGGPRLAPGANRGDGPDDSQEPADIVLRRVPATDLDDVPLALGLHADGALDADERYRLVVSADGVEISAAAAEGAFRGLTTLRQLITASADGRLPQVDIADGPRFAWRGLSLDVVRTFHPVAEVERVIDMLSLHKLNVLHLHLTDDQGWRFEVPGWPRLHELSDAGTPLADAAGTAADGSSMRPGGHFTDADIARLVAYARARHVVLVPEVDLPGHVTAAVAAYPELAGPAAGPSAVLAVGTERASEFLRAVVAREAELFPDAGYLHVGADEAWGIAPDAYARYVSEVRELVLAAGRRVLGWQEHARASTTPGSVAQLWIEPEFLTGADDIAEHVADTPPELLELMAAHFAATAGDLDAAVRQGANILLSPASQLYFDRPIAEASLDREQEDRRPRLGMPVYPPLALADIVARDPLSSAPGLDPSRVAGVEAAIWCETITDAADLELLLLPRLAGLAEVGWRATRAWDDHAAALAAQAPAWDRRGWGYLRAATVPW